MEKMETERTETTETIADSTVVDQVVSVVPRNSSKVITMERVDSTFTLDVSPQVGTHTV